MRAMPSLSSHRRDQGSPTPSRRALASGGSRASTSHALRNRRGAGRGPVPARDGPHLVSQEGHYSNRRNPRKSRLRIRCLPATTSSALSRTCCSRTATPTVDALVSRERLGAAARPRDGDGPRPFGRSASGQARTARRKSRQSRDGPGKEWRAGQSERERPGAASEVRCVLHARGDHIDRVRVHDRRGDGRVVPDEGLADVRHAPDDPERGADRGEERRPMGELPHEPDSEDDRDEKRPGRAGRPGLLISAG